MMPQPLPATGSPLETLKQFARLRLIAVDLDGTLLPPPSEQFELEEQFQRLARSLRRSGIVVTVATGRTLWGAAPIIRTLSIPRGTPLVLYNGSLVLEYGNARVLSHRTIPVADLHRLVQFAAQAASPCFIYFFDGRIPQGWGLFGGCEAVVSAGRGDQGFVAATDPNGLALRNISVCAAVREFGEPTAILMGAGKDAERFLQDWAIDSGVSLTSSGSDLIEVRPRESDKARALQVIAEMLGLGRQEIAVIGDNDNDAEMLHWAGVSVAVRGASPLAVSSARYGSNWGAFSAVIELLRLVKHAVRFSR